MFAGKYVTLQRFCPKAGGMIFQGVKAQRGNAFINEYA
jgi:hypothetical protein